MYISPDFLVLVAVAVFVYGAVRLTLDAKRPSD